MKLFLLIPLYIFLALQFDSLKAQIYSVPGAQQQPAWVFPMWFENGDGQKDTIYFCYDPQSQSDGYNNDSDSLMGEKIIHVDKTKFNMSFDAYGLNDSMLLKVDVNFEFDLALIDIFTQNYILPVTLRWDPNVFYSDSIPFPDLDPAPRAEGRLFFDLPTIVDNCLFDYPIEMTDTTIGTGISCSKNDSIIFTGDGLSVLTFNIAPWKGIFLNAEPVHSSIQLFPSLTSSSIQLHLPSNRSTTLTLINLLGEKVKEQTITGSDITIDVSELPAGMYVVRVEGWSGKFVKE